MLLKPAQIAVGIIGIVLLTAGITLFLLDQTRAILYPIYEKPPITALPEQSIPEGIPPEPKPPPKTVTAPETVPLDTDPPIISNLEISDIRESSATISWITNEPTTGHIEYWVPLLNYQRELGMKPKVKIVFVETWTISSNITLDNLTPGMTYYFHVQVQDKANNKKVSDDDSFTTKAPEKSESATWAVTDYKMCLFNKPYDSESGLTVIVHSISFAEQEGFYTYTIRYTLENNTSNNALLEKTFKAWFKGDGCEPQYGAFTKLMPGENIKRSYTWKVLKTKTVSLIEFEGDFLNRRRPESDTLKWRPEY